MSFDVAAEAYDRFMGRYSTPLSAPMADFAGVRKGDLVLDVGCGPGALAAELASRLGPAAVTAVDPSEPFVVVAPARNPGVNVLQASAEALPFADAMFDAAGLRQIEGIVLSVSLAHPSFETWREPFTGGVGLAGVFVASLDPDRQVELRERCRTGLPTAPFTLTREPGRRAASPSIASARFARGPVIRPMSAVASH